MVITDCGTHFKIGVFRVALDSLHAQHQMSSIYHAKTGGLVGRLNHTLVSALRGFLLGETREWNKELPGAVRLANITKQESLGASPYELLFGCLPRLPGEHPGVLPLTPAEDVPVQTKRMEAIRRLRESQAKQVAYALEKQKSYHDWRPNPGDLVLRRRKERKVGVSTKLLDTYVRPFAVRRCIFGDTYDLFDSRRRTSVPCHLSLLKPYRSRSGTGVPSHQ